MGVPLIRAQDVLNLPEQEQIILVRGPVPAIRAFVRPFYKDQSLIDMTEPNPYRNEPEQRIADDTPFTPDTSEFRPMTDREKLDNMTDFQLVYTFVLPIIVIFYDFASLWWVAAGLFLFGWLTTVIPEKFIRINPNEEYEIASQTSGNNMANNLAKATTAAKVGATIYRGYKAYKNRR